MTPTAPAARGGPNGPTDPDQRQVRRGAIEFGDRGPQSGDARSLWTAFPLAAKPTSTPPSKRRARRSRHGGGLGGVEKAELLHEVAQRIREKQKAIATMMTQETGKPLIESVDCVKWVAESFDYFAEVGRSAQGVYRGARRGASGELRPQRALRRGGLHRAVQFSAAADGLESGAGDRGRQHGGVQAAAPEPARGTPARRSL